MDSLLWNVRTSSDFSLAAPIVQSLLLVAILSWDHFFLISRHFWRLFAYGEANPRQKPPGPLPSALVVIPSLLRKRDELESMLSTIDSVGQNGYPGELFIVVSIDGCADAPQLFGELSAWAVRQEYGARVYLYVTGTPMRRGKPMAIDHGIEFLKQLVAAGQHAEFPKVYISTDADADLGEHALERLVDRLMAPHPITGWPARAVSGNLYLRGNDFWRGLRHFFTVEGQLTIQVARHYMVSNIARHNLRLVPMCGVPGVLYCSWTRTWTADLTAFSAPATGPTQ